MFPKRKNARKNTRAILPCNIETSLLKPSSNIDIFKSVTIQKLKAGSYL